MTKLITALVFAISIICLGAGDQAALFDKVGHKLMCTCGCNEILLECNHVGCPNSDGMRSKLATYIGNGSTDEAIFHDFAQEYGDIVVAAPFGGGFNRVAWIMPFAVLFLGLAGVGVVVRQWRLRPIAKPSAVKTKTSSHLDEFRRQAREETEQ